MGFDRVTKLMEKGLIEIAPLAYMRGRTLMAHMSFWTKRKIPRPNK